MRLSLITEAQDEYYALELARAARKLADEILEVKAGQTVAITADTQSDRRVVAAVAAAIYAAGAVPVVLSYHTQLRAQMEPPPAVAAAVAASDVWIELAVAYTMYTHAWHAALKEGVQYCELGGMDVDGMVRCIGRQDVTLLAAMGDRIEQLLAGADVHVTSAAGSDLAFTNSGNIAAFRMMASPEKIPIMLAGQVSWTPIEETVNGRLVADGILYPPAEVGVMRQTVAFRIERGKIVAIDGEREAHLLRAWLDQLDDPVMNRIAHVSIGFNPGITVPTGRMVEDERAFGDIDFGFGAWVGRPAAGHFDFTCRGVSITVGGSELERDGVFVHPDVRAICRAMGVPHH